MVEKKFEKCLAIVYIVSYRILTLYFSPRDVITARWFIFIFDFFQKFNLSSCNCCIEYLGLLAVEL